MERQGQGYVDEGRRRKGVSPYLTPPCLSVPLPSSTYPLNMVMPPLAFAFLIFLCVFQAYLSLPFLYLKISLCTCPSPCVIFQIRITAIPLPSFLFLSPAYPYLFSSPFLAINFMQYCPPIYPTY